MSNTIRLSICIPTCNFSKYIAETLDSIVGQLTDDVEIVVVDGASADNTPDIVRKFQDRCPNMKYIYLQQKGGIDLDMAKAVESASGEYCWFFSADDIMKPNAIAKVLSEVKYGFDVYLCGFTLCSYDMQPIADHLVLNTKSEIVFDLADTRDRLDYFRRAQTTTEFFSFCSSLVFKKAKWDFVKSDNSFIGTCWAHAARIFGMLPNGLQVKYLHGPLFSKRCDNDSFSDKGIVNRMRISIDGYHRIGESFFGGNSEEAFHIRRCVRAEWPLEKIMTMKIDCIEQGNQSDLLMLNELVAKHYSDPLILNKVSILVFNHANLKIYKVIRLAANRMKTIIRPLYKAVEQRIRFE